MKEEELKVEVRQAISWHEALESMKLHMTFTFNIREWEVLTRDIKRYMNQNCQSSFHSLITPFLMAIDKEVNVFREKINRVKE